MTPSTGDNTVLERVIVVVGDRGCHWGPVNVCVREIDLPRPLRVAYNGNKSGDTESDEERVEEGHRDELTKA